MDKNEKVKVELYLSKNKKPIAVIGKCIGLITDKDLALCMTPSCSRADIGFSKDPMSLNEILKAEAEGMRLAVAIDSNNDHKEMLVTEKVSYITSCTAKDDSGVVKTTLGVSCIDEKNYIMVTQL